MAAAGDARNFPEPPPALHGAVNKAGRVGGPPWTAWGGTHPEEEEAAIASMENPDPEAVAARTARAEARARERVELEERAELQRVLDQIRCVRRQLEHGREGERGQLEGGTVGEPRTGRGG